MLTLRLTYCLLAISILFTLMSGCSWTPQVETTIYEGPHASVSLITVSEESFEADHPVTLQTDTIAQVLRGIYLRQNQRLLQKLFSSDNSAKPVFTEEQTTILSPQLQKAFSQVTPEEHVAFQIRDNHETGIQGIKGTMYVKGEDLYVSLTFTAQVAHASPKTAGRGVRPYQEGRKKPVVMFKPKEALHDGMEPHWLFGGKEKNSIVINIPLLASLHREHTTPALQAGQDKHKLPHASPPRAEDTLPHTAMDAFPPSSTHQPQTSSQTPENSDIQTLLEEIRALRKELDDQKKAIDRLEQGETKTR